MIDKIILELLNPWWKEKKISRDLSPRYKRKIFPGLKSLIKKRQITTITGLRRVGKSTLMFQLIEDLLNSKIEPEKILYFSFDEKIENLIDVLSKYSELVKINWKHEKCFVFFDEIQKLEDWSNKLKIIYDNFKNIKIIISGSGSFQLEKEAKINLTGRHFITEVQPLSFIEFLEIKKSKIDLNKIELWEEEIKKEFKKYLYRPFPEIVFYKELNLIKSYIKDSVIEKVLKIDLSDKFKNVNEDLLVNLIEIFYDRPGTYLNLDELSKELKIGKTNLIQHLYYLEFARIIRRIKNFRPGVRVASRKLQRIYPFHWSLRFGWNGKIDSETIVSSFFDSKYYWREHQKEVDFLKINKEILPIEVKEASKIEENKLKSLLYFMKKFNLKKAFLIFNGEESEIRKKKILIKKIPFWKLFLNPVLSNSNIT